MVTEKGIQSNQAIPPGEFLEEVIQELGMSKDDLAHRIDRPATKLSGIFKGERAITSDTALRLEKAVGVPAHIWVGLEAEYRLTLARQEERRREDKLKDEASLVSKYPYQDLVKAGEIEKHSRGVDKARALQDFFGVISLTKIPELRRYQAAFRTGRSSRGERTPEAVAAWLRMGERRAQRMECAPFDEKRLRAVLNDLRAMTLEPPEKFQEPLLRTLADLGVALIICPHFAKTKTHGATFWLGREKAVMMITIRGKWSDIFWFSLFHEIGHILYHSRQGVILEDNGEDQREKEADTFASNTLIPKKAYKMFVKGEKFYNDSIRAFADEIMIDPGIIVGRLQHDGKLPQSWGNRLRSRYHWKNK